MASTKGPKQLSLLQRDASIDRVKVDVYSSGLAVYNLIREKVIPGMVRVADFEQNMLRLV